MRRRDLVPWISLVVGAGALYRVVYSPNKSEIVVFGLIVAIAMFLFRLRARLYYGAVEVAFGVFVLWDAAGKGRGDFSSDFSNDFSRFQLTVVLAQTFAALYVVIRGLDNCYQGCPKVGAMLDRWVGR